MDKYYCPNCGATLNDQCGFDPLCGVWTCTECGKLLMDDDVYEGETYVGVAWFCDRCGALLNKQSGFSDSYGSWICTECGHLNGTTKDDILEEDDSPECPNCGAKLKDQFCYGDYQTDWQCTECGAHLHHDYSSAPYAIVEEDKGPKCPLCGAYLKEQLCFVEYEDDWECTECGAHLHHDYSTGTYEVVDDENNDGSNCSSSDSYAYATNSVNHTQPAQAANQTSSIKKKKVRKLSKSEVRKQRVKAFLFKRKKIELRYDFSDLLGKSIDVVETLFYNQAFNRIKKCQ